MKVSIMQPTYLPWLGYFGMMDLSDMFIFYDDVQFSKQSWQNRNRIKLANGDLAWLTLPFIRDGLNTMINNVKLNDAANWRRKHWQSIYYSYCKSPYFKEYQEKIKKIYDNNWNYLCDLNIYIIKLLADLFGIGNVDIVKSSEFSGIDGEKTGRLIKILRLVGATNYISPVGAKTYLKEDDFVKENIKLKWFEYQHPVYEQKTDEFTPYLSAIDLLFNVGGNSLNVIRSGYSNVLVDVR